MNTNVIAVQVCAETDAPRTIAVKSDATYGVNRTVSPTQRGKLELLQCFRGFAAVSVLLYHVAVIVRERVHYDFFWHYLRPAATGVDFFFVLSGFIILWVHGKDIGRKDKLGVYAWRRFMRVYPLYALVTLALLPLYLAGFGHASKINAKLIAFSLTLAPLPPGQEPIVGQGWTLTHEALFYVVFGLFILFGRRWAAALSITAVAGSLAESILRFYGHNRPGPYWISHWIFSPVNLEFAAGCCAAMIVTRMASRTAVWLLPAGIFWLAAVWTIPSQNGHEILAANDLLSAKMVLLFGPPYMLITVGAVACEAVFRYRAPGLLMGIGDATYSIYLSHFIIISGLTIVLLHVVPTQGPAFSVVLAMAACVTIASGYLIHRWVEAPILRHLRSRS